MQEALRGASRPRVESVDRMWLLRRLLRASLSPTGECCSHKIAIPQGYGRSRSGLASKFARHGREPRRPLLLVDREVEPEYSSRLWQAVPIPISQLSTFTGEG